MIESKRAVIIINYIKRHITQTIYNIPNAQRSTQSFEGV